MVSAPVGILRERFPWQHKPDSVCPGPRRAAPICVSFCLEIPNTVFRKPLHFIYFPFLAQPASADGEPARSSALSPVTPGFKCLFLSNAKQKQAELSCILFFSPLPSVLNLFPCLAGFNLHFLTLSHLQSQPVLQAFSSELGSSRGSTALGLGGYDGVKVKGLVLTV